jgi:glycosyltransferase involved in cell wall biosynthesis
MGGMFEYVKMWLDESKVFTNHAHFLLKNNLGYPKDEVIIFKTIKSDSSIKQIAIIALLNFILPGKIIGRFFRQDYQELIQSVDTIHVLSASLNNYAFFKWILKKYPKKKIIYTLHDPKPHTEKISPLARIIRNHGNKGIFKIASEKNNFFLHLHSSFLIDNCPKKINEIIIHSHPLPKTRVIRTRKADGKIRLGFMGRIEHYKGLDVFLQALNSLPQNVTKNIEVHIIGRGELDEKWNHTTFKTVVSNELVSDQFFHQNMADLDCLVLPYLNASQTGVGYMGLAYNIPMILSETGGLPDVFRLCKTGKSRLVLPNNPKHLEEVLMQFIIAC